MTSRTPNDSSPGSLTKRAIARLPDPVRSRMRGLIRGAPSLDSDPPVSHLDATPSRELLTADDIISAYRLFHGREPDAAGLEFFANQIGKWSVRDLLPYFAHSAEFRQSDTYRVLLGGLQDRSTHVVEVGDHCVVVPDGDDAIGGVLTRTGSYEPHIVAVFREVLGQGSVMVDGGANIGILTMQAAAMVGATGYVLAIEALAYNAGLINISAALNGFDHVEVVHAALGNDRKAVVMSSAGGSNGIVSGPLTEALKTTDAAMLSSAEVVPGVRLDDIAGHLERLDLIKLDVEGAEALAIGGASSVLARHRPTLILEYSPGLLAQVSGVEGISMLTGLTNLGYMIQILDNERRIETGTDVRACDEFLAERNADHLDLLAIPD